GGSTGQLAPRPTESNPGRGVASMNAEVLLKYFDRISEAPDAVPRLRRFVLDLAVRGKLVEQDPDDEPASALLARIPTPAQNRARKQADERASPTRATGTSDRPAKSPSGAEDGPYQLPANWRWSQLAEVGLVNPRNSAADTVLASFVPMPKISAEYGIANEHEVRAWGDIKSGFTHFAEGDVGLAKITPCFENGKSTVFRGLTGGIGAGTTELHIVRPIFVCAEYILIFLKSPFFIASGIPKMTGTAGQKRVSTEYFAHSPFPLPPLAEQHRIVAKVDELMALCDRLEAAQKDRELRRDRLTASSIHHLTNGAAPDELREHARFFINHLPKLTARPEQIKQIRQTILNLAVRGKLVPQDPADEPACELLKRIQAEKARRLEDGTLRRERPLAPVAEDEAPFAIPASWSWARIGTLSLLTEYGTSVQSMHAGDGIPVLKMGDIQNGGVLLGGQKKVPRQIEDLPQLFLKRLDLLYNRTNSAELVGKTGIYLGEDDAYTFASYLIRIRFLNNLTSPIYSNLAMNARYFRETQILPELQQQCGQANVNGSKLRNMLIPLPPLGEQHRIVARADELMALSRQLETQLTLRQTESRSLLDAVLQKALAS
ncbi:MAG: restriction endonuclease subunit S, partial [Bryobacteraceae bacterium]